MGVGAGGGGGGVAMADTATLESGVGEGRGLGVGSGGGADRGGSMAPASFALVTSTEAARFASCFDLDPLRITSIWRGAFDSVSPVVLDTAFAPNLARGLAAFSFFALTLRTPAFARCFLAGADEPEPAKLVFSRSVRAIFVVTVALAAAFSQRQQMKTPKT